LLIDEYYFSYECPFFGGKLGGPYANVLQNSRKTVLEIICFVHLGIKIFTYKPIQNFW
jgi:hypothetical protein